MVTWGGILFASLGAIALAYVLWYHAVERIGSASTSLWSNVTPAVGLAVAWVWLGEQPNPLQLVGAAVILASVALTRKPADG